MEGIFTGFDGIYRQVRDSIRQFRLAASLDLPLIFGDATARWTAVATVRAARPAKSLPRRCATMVRRDARSVEGPCHEHRQGIRMLFERRVMRIVEHRGVGKHRYPSLADPAFGEHARAGHDAS